jgi:hypothetical protein
MEIMQKATSDVSLCCVEYVGDGIGSYTRLRTRGKILEGAKRAYYGLTSDLDVAGNGPVYGYGSD